CHVDKQLLRNDAVKGSGRFNGYVLSEHHLFARGIHMACLGARQAPASHTWSEASKQGMAEGQRRVGVVEVQVFLSWQSRWRWDLRRRRSKPGPDFGSCCETLGHVEAVGLVADVRLAERSLNVWNDLRTKSASCESEA